MVEFAVLKTTGINMNMASFLRLNDNENFPAQNHSAYFLFYLISSFQASGSFF